MKSKITITVSALAVASTVSTAIAHNYAIMNSLAFYCVDYTTEGGETIPLPYDPVAFPDISPGFCTFTVALTIAGEFSPYTMYGYRKTTPPGIPCSPLTAGCPRIKATIEL